MDAATAIEKATELAAQFTAPTGESSWKPYLGSSGWSWSSELLARLVVAVGDQDIVYATGYVTDEAGAPRARVAVFTKGAVIEGRFGSVALSDPATVSVRATGLGSVSAIRVLDAGPLSAPDGLWPRRLRVELEYRPKLDVPPLNLPLEPHPTVESTAKLATFLPALIAALES